MAISVPVATGQGVYGTLRFLGGEIRMAPAASATNYYDGDGTSPDGFAGTRLIALSTGVRDAGSFGTSDDRYLPFEGAGLANSRWQLKVSAANNLFRSEEIADVVLHVQFTARPSGPEIGRALVPFAEAALGIQSGAASGSQLLDLAAEFPDAWASATATTEAGSMSLDLVSRLSRRGGAAAGSVSLGAKVAVRSATQPAGFTPISGAAGWYLKDLGDDLENPVSVSGVDASWEAAVVLASYSAS